MSGQEQGIRIGLAGIAVPADDERILDVLFDDRRIWSFRAGPEGPGRPAGDGELRVAWPPVLTGFLNGVADVTVLDQAGAVVAEAEVQFGGSDDRVRVEDAEGRPLVLDSKGRLTQPFGEDADATGPLLEAAHLVIDTLRDLGIEAFLAYGTLLGAVREGNFIGHDNDLDLGYVSEQKQPVDVIAESFRLERALVRAGMSIERYSGAGIKVSVRDGSGVLRGLDVFGGFWDGDRLGLLGEILTPFERSWMLPLGTASLAGHDFPAPAQPERLLEAMYGPGWKVPDPTFAFDPGTEARDRLDLWFRGIRDRRNRWDRWYSGSAHRRPNFNPHELARIVHRAEPDETTVIDVGCGRGQDVAWLARKGRRAVGLDYSERAMAFFAGRAAEKGWPLELHTANLLELRQSVAWGARLARTEGPRVVLARHFVNATSLRGRDGLWRLSSMVLRGGGRLYLEFFGSQRPRPFTADDLVWEVDPDEIVAEAQAAGGTVEDTSWFTAEGYEMPWRGRDEEWRPAPRGCRMVVRWA